ncbi:M23 family metallopeptidase [Verrucosispora sp. WMMC514]|uniref:M23 family metallopeptidase n=1 Tax=Verrucosispora sp. WMMC514 TaxID=3015156 RepID=UPI00248A96F3|nr:M23 family metallopeptidase [Verrucosispora sp. WMMC514]WBB93399.1 M23 family metallopeptidase [Verrucosispora sp. WMMC514]
MNIRSLVTAVIAVVAVVVLCAGGLGGLLTGSTAADACLPIHPSTDPAGPPATVGAWPQVDGWDGDQVTNAATIVTTGARLGVPARGWVIAVATAMQESSLRNLPGGDRDSVGLFQQRPSQGWGTPAQLQDPAYAAGAFYATLLTISGWQSMPLTDAAQAVQISAYPDAYATWEHPAAQLVTVIASHTHLPANGLPGCGPPGPWTQPVLAPVGSGFRSHERPSHDGVDLSVPRGTTIRAASAGTVRTVRCNAIHRGTGREWGCHRDGDPHLTAGCGWYIDIDHPGGVMTRYCHLDKPPIVTVGQQVTVGEPIGVVGSTGRSSGPHLHYEVHLRGDASAAGAVDPEPFMAGKGAPLGSSHNAPAHRRSITDRNTA